MLELVSKDDEVKLVAAGKADKPGAMLRAARYLAASPARGLPRIIALTDPIRAPDPFAALAALPRGEGLIWRAYGIGIRRAERLKLARAARARHCLLLLAGSRAGAGLSGIDGIHLAERMLTAPYTDGRAARRHRAGPGLIVTAAAHSRRAIVAAARAGADAVLISPVFPTESHAGGATLGVVRFAQLARFAGSLGLTVYALGGVTGAARIGRLRGSGAAGIAGIGFLAR